MRIMVQDEIHFKIDEIKGLLSGQKPEPIKNSLTVAPINAEIKLKSHSCMRNKNSSLFEESASSPPTQD